MRHSTCHESTTHFNFQPEKVILTDYVAVVMPFLCLISYAFRMFKNTSFLCWSIDRSDRPSVDWLTSRFRYYLWHHHRRRHNNRIRGLVSPMEKVWFSPHTRCFLLIIHRFRLCGGGSNLASEKISTCFGAADIFRNQCNESSIHQLNTCTVLDQRELSRIFLQVLIC